MNDISRVEPTPAAVSTHTEAASILRIIADAATNPAVDVVKLQALLDLQERVLAKQAEAAFNASLARLSATMPRVKKNGRVDLGSGKGGYDFATWADMDAVIRPLMRQEGFTLSFDMEHREGGGAVVVGKLLHADGHSQTARIPLPADGGAGRNNLQAMGSTLSYGKRYCAEMLLNIVREGADDDGVTGGAEFITPDQVATIKAAVAEQAVPLEPFLAFMEAGMVEGIRLADFPKAMNALAARKRQTAAKGAKL